MYGRVSRLYRWPRRQMMIATNISGRTIRTVQSWREESARFHFLKRLPTKLVRSECRTGRGTSVERGAMRSFLFPSYFRKQGDRCAGCLTEKPCCSRYIARVQVARSKAKFWPRWRYREEISCHKTVNYLQRKTEKRKEKRRKRTELTLYRR